MKKAVLALGTAFAVAACAPAIVDDNATSIPQVEVFASASLGPLDGHINAIAFAPVTTVPWEGRLVIAPESGGLMVMDVEGQEDSFWQGEAMRILATRADFNLRGLGANLVLALNNDGAVRPFIVDDARGQIIDAPVVGLPDSGVSTLCAMQSDAASPSFLIGNTDKTLAVWTISDTGEAALSAQQQQSGSLSIALAHCANVGGEMFGTGEKGGLFKLSIANNISMLSGVESIAGEIVALHKNGENIVLISDPVQGNLHAFNANLQALYTLVSPKALSTPGAAIPGAIAVSSRSFGGAGFSAGLMAVADDSTNRIALVVLDTIPAKAETTDAPQN